MRVLLAAVASGLLGFSIPAFAQSAGPVLIDQTVSQSVPQGSAGTANGEDALAQASTGGTFGGISTTTLLAGGLAAGTAALIVVVANQNENDSNQPVSP